MAKRPSYAIKEKILLAVREAPATYAQLERKINTGFRTIKSNCEELEHFGFLTIEKIDEHPANARPSWKILLSEMGKNHLKIHRHSFSTRGARMKDSNSLSTTL